jgi:hypothetical protein
MKTATELLIFLNRNFYHRHYFCLAHYFEAYKFLLIESCFQTKFVQSFFDFHHYFEAKFDLDLLAGQSK